MYFEFSRMPADSYRIGDSGLLLLCLCDVLRALINSLVCRFGTGAGPRSLSYCNKKRSIQLRGFLSLMPNTENTISPILCTNWQSDGDYHRRCSSLKSFRMKTACFRPSQITFLPNSMCFREWCESYSAFGSVWVPNAEIIKPPSTCFHHCCSPFATLTVWICLQFPLCGEGLPEAVSGLRALIG